MYVMPLAVFAVSLIATVITSVVWLMEQAVN